ncbi:MAG: AAA family ATPase [Gemmatimonadaceae bacterium]
MTPRRTSTKNTPDGAETLVGGPGFLREVKRGPGGDASRFPFSVPVVRDLGVLDLSARVTFFVGENGSGKSTLLEGIALAAGLPAIGSDDAALDDTLAPQRELARALKLVWNRRTRRGFFLRAEDFFGFTKRLSSMRLEFQQRLVELEAEYAERSAWAKGLAMGPARASIAALERRYGVDLDANSHGQSFLKLFQSRFVPGGLYLLDEPEAPLSPQSQLALMVMMGEMLAQGAQFVIATHSPILLAYPGARIWSFDRSPAGEVPYEELEHVRLTRDFLNAPGRYLRALEPERPTA